MRLAILCLAFLLTACEAVTEEDRARAAAAAEYLKSFRVVRVCPVAPEAFGQFVMQASDGRYWLSYYAQPSEWRYVAPLGDVSPEQVC